MGMSQSNTSWSLSPRLGVLKNKGEFYVGLQICDTLNSQALILMLLSVFVTGNAGTIS